MHKDKPVKQRLDQLITEKGLVGSRQRAKAMIMAGRVLVDDAVCDKPGIPVSTQAQIVVKDDDNPYVSRGGLKLEKAFETFPISAKDRVCLDIGASTGGFTDCLLQNGAKKVYACDVGYGQLDWSLRKDDRVVVIERTNIRYMDYDVIGEKVDMVVADTSFISLKKVIPAAEKFMAAGTEVLALIKPQFEAGRENIGKGGVVRDPKTREAVRKDLSDFFQERGYEIRGIVPSPILGPKGNQESIIFMVFQESP
ncbi:TlyA family RNA methyltransferase [Desulfospira joergensenii]|uniref:TlyA family RNA methyltransferase n=1 Tax=Desulfospira joergensenii TaxID=53329 RepID=UPI0003B635B1|nr:TlyA family RNA methyltransferase [Desulfospira joergensenii]